MRTFTQIGSNTSIVIKIVSLTRIVKVSGLELIQAQLLWIVVIPTVSAIFFDGYWILASLTVVGHLIQLMILNVMSQCG